MDDALLQRLHAVLGDAGLLLDPQRMAPYLSDWRNAYRGKAAAVLRPASTDEVAAAVRLCRRAAIPACAVARSPMPRASSWCCR